MALPVAFLLNIWWLLVLIGVMILIHEAGHFWAARLFDVQVDTFSFGFGPRLFGFRRGETDYRFSLVPFGGYVKMAGEQPLENLQAAEVPSQPDTNPRHVNNKPRWQRLIITAAGPFMNVVLAIGVLTGLYMVSFEKIIDNKGAIVGYVVSGSPAAKAGIQPGDKIVRLNGQNNPDWEYIVTKEIESAGVPMTVSIERNGHEWPASVTPAFDQKQGFGTAGWEGQNQIQISAVTDGMPAAAAGLKKGDLLVKINDTPIHSLFTLPEVVRRSDGKPLTIEYVRNGADHAVTIRPLYRNPDGTARWMIGVATDVKWNVQKMSLPFPEALHESLVQNGKNASLIFEFLRGMVARRMSAKNLEGPIGIAHEATTAAAEGPSAFLTLMAVVSLNLAIVNLLPIPILDGAMILTLLIEIIMGRDISMAVKETALKVGFVFLMMLVVFTIYNDIARRITPGMVIGHIPAKAGQAKPSR